VVVRFENHTYLLNSLLVLVELPQVVE
jgi:hypothetical protein